MNFYSLVFIFLLLLGVLVALIVTWSWGKKPKLPNLSDFVPQSVPVATLQPQVSQRDAALEEQIEIIAAMIRRDEMEKRKEAAVKRLAELKVEKGSA